MINVAHVIVQGSDKIHYTKLDQDDNFEGNTYCGLCGPFEVVSRIAYRDRMAGKVCENCFEKFVDEHTLRVKPDPIIYEEQ